MRIGILSGSGNWHVEDLLRAGGERGHELQVLDFGSLAAAEPGGANLYADRCASPFIPSVGSVPAADSEVTPPLDAVLVRMMPLGHLEQVIFRMDVLQAAARRGLVVMNPPRALEACIDKFLTTHLLAVAGLPTPPTWVGQTAAQALTAFSQLGGDVVIKPLFGSEGKGVERLTDDATARQIFEQYHAQQRVIYLQKFIAHQGWDLRVFVLGEQVLAAMRRHAVDGWRTNISLGGRGEPVTLSEEEKELALAAARAVGCPMAGVDLLPGPSGLQVIEVNAVPGWRGLSAATGVDVAKAVIDYVVQQVGR